MRLDRLIRKLNKQLCSPQGEVVPGSGVFAGVTGASPCSRAHARAPVHAPVPSHGHVTAAVGVGASVPGHASSLSGVVTECASASVIGTVSVTWSVTSSVAIEETQASVTWSDGSASRCLRTTPYTHYDATWTTKQQELDSIGFELDSRHVKQHPTSLPHKKDHSKIKIRLGNFTSTPARINGSILDLRSFVNLTCFYPVRPRTKANSYLTKISA